MRKKENEEEQKEKANPVIKEKDDEKEEMEKVIQVESEEIEYRKDMPDSKTEEEVPVREVVGKKKKKEVEKHTKKKKEGDPEVDTDSLVQATEPDHLQTWVGIAIGILGMAVIFLLLTIGIILGKNRRRIFSKPPLESVNTMNSEYGGILTHLRPDLSEEKAPTHYYRGRQPLLPRQASWGDLLSDYQNIPVVPISRNFGSTPLFTVPSLDRATVRRVPPTSYSVSNHLRDLAQTQKPLQSEETAEYGYSAPQDLRHSYCPADDEAFYAASDIVTLGRF